MARDTTGWSEVDWVDLQPAPGSFVSSTYDNYEVQGRTIRALNWLHAKHLWLRVEVERQGEEWGRCAHCNHAIRYAVVFVDPDGNHHMIGEDCAHFINSTLNKTQWAERRRLSDIKAVTTKLGERFTLSLEVPAWLWNVPKPERPAFLSLSKWEGPRRQTKWYLTIWGDNPCEVLRNWEVLQALRKNLV